MLLVFNLTTVDYFSIKINRHKVIKNYWKIRAL
jgi:hypothetical protein